MDEGRDGWVLDGIQVREINRKHQNLDAEYSKIEPTRVKKAPILYLFIGVSQAKLSPMVVVVLLSFLLYMKMLTMLKLQIQQQDDGSVGDDHHDRGSAVSRSASRYFERIQ